MANIAGTVAPGFESVRDAFAANFAREGDDREIGAALAVYVRGSCVVDLWGGHADAAESKPWARDTLINVWSASKGITSIALAMLIDQGRLSYDDTVAKHWPEFAAGGKGAITIGQLVSHQAGLNGFAEPTALEDLYDWPLATARLAAQTPFWTPGTGASYHALTHGFLLGELIRRATGQLPGDFIRTALTGPLGADFHIGLPQAQDWRAAEIVPPSNATIGAASPPEIPGRATKNPQPQPTSPNTRAWRAAHTTVAVRHITPRSAGVLAWAFHASMNRLSSTNPRLRPKAIRLSPANHPLLVLAAATSPSRLSLKATWSRTPQKKLPR